MQLPMEPRKMGASNYPPRGQLRVEDCIAPMMMMVISSFLCRLCSRLLFVYGLLGRLNGRSPGVSLLLPLLLLLLLGC